MRERAALLVDGVSSMEAQTGQESTYHRVHFAGFCEVQIVVLGALPTTLAKSNKHPGGERMRRSSEARIARLDRRQSKSKF